jgi:chromosome segregation ATPase
LRCRHKRISPSTHHEDTGMDAAIIDRDTAQDQDSTRYKSRPGALIWFFRKSRDRWKEKHQALKATVKKHKNRVADANKSREQWRLKAEVTSQRLETLEAENTQLLTKISALEREKKTEPKLAHR